jgi:signal transduction histidine kinase
MSIINDLLDCSKLENGQVQKEEIPFDLDVLISSCVELMRPRVKSKNGLQLSYHIDARCGTTKLISDPSRLRQILHNLLSNAIKFSSVGSVTVTVSPFMNKYNTKANDNCIDPLATSESSASVTNSAPIDKSAAPDNGTDMVHLQFEVTDTGIGIATNEQTIVFERYRQANAGISRTFGGTGLGLPICKGLVELLGGNIGLCSKIGTGTTVYFDIPFKVAPGDSRDIETTAKKQMYNSI